MAAAGEPHSSLYDTIVVGAGIQGSFTAYHLAKRGGETLLLDQFPLPHSRGSSHGQSRIIRHAYPQEHYAQMMAESYRLWEQLEAEAGTPLYRQTGLLVLGANTNPEFQRCCRTLVKHDVPGELFTTESLHRRFPGIRPYHGEVGVSDHTAGVLSADRALRAVQDGFRRRGGALRDGEKVTDIKPGVVVTVTTSRGVYQAKSLVITAGPWANKLLAPLGLQLPLQTLRINVCYWKETVPGAYGVSANFPCFLVLCAPPHIYGLPSNEYPGLVKICYHSGSPADPEERDQPPEASALPDIQILQDFVSKYLPGLVPEPAVVEHCMYTNTPDEDFVLDRHPKFSNIIIGAGFSGHGFKLAPVVGKLLCQLSVGEEPSYALEPFRIHRFPGLPAPAL
ncbi:peroxisomal sarcosine oxidase [Mauremys reevesii]|uniref:peroxisomal sarcosine oxidase n=1 Tax=Mauremys reevesii TaxID=260615 RepID=UPI00193FB08F|nr:peroxisomal sarcosine oxidase [Mauremys reevesii]